MPVFVPAVLAPFRIGLDVVLGDAFRGCAGKLGNPILLSAEQSVVADPPEPLWHQVLRETPDEGRPGQGHFALHPALGVVLALETDRFVLLVDLRDALVAHRDPAGIACQVAHHRAGVPQSLAAENVPASGGEREPPVAPLLKAADRFRPLDGGRGIKFLDLSQHDATEHPGHGFYRKEVVRPGSSPMAIAVAAASGADEDMEVRMPVE